MAEPFLDRGVRKVAGSRAFVTSTQSLAHYFNTNNSDNCPGRVIWVWNTGVGTPTYPFSLPLVCALVNRLTPFCSLSMCLLYVCDVL